MIEKTIMLSKIEDVKKFVHTVINYDCDIDLICGKYIVDAKSIMGIFSLDLSKPILMKANCSEDSELLKGIEEFLYTG